MANSPSLEFEPRWTYALKPLATFLSSSLVIRRFSRNSWTCYRTRYLRFGLTCASIGSPELRSIPRAHRFANSRSHAELPPNFAGPNELRKEPVVLPFVPNPACDDRRMHLQSTGEIHHVHGSRSVLHRARLPCRARDERFFHPIVCLRLPGAFPSRVEFSQRIVVDGGIPPVVVHVSAHMGEFVQQAKPEIVDSVVAQSESDHRSFITESECHPVEIRPRQVSFDHQRNAMLGQQFLCQLRAIFGPTPDFLTPCGARYRRQSSNFMLGRANSFLCNSLLYLIVASLI